MAVDVEARTREWNNILPVRSAGENNRCFHMNDGRARVVVAMNGFDTEVDSILDRMSGMMDMLREDIAILTGTGLRATWEEPLTF